MRKLKFWEKIIILSAFVITVVIATIFLVFSIISKPQNGMDDAATITENANLTNWGFACEINGEMYYSDYKTGIYIAKESGDELCIEGIYSDLCYLGDKLFCVEYFDKKTDDNSSCACMRLIMIDIKTWNSESVFNTPTDGDIVYLLHKTKDKIYFLLEDQLYTVDPIGTVEYTGISHVKKVTNSGVYTSRYPKSGFRLVSFENKELKVFDELDAYVVELNLEIDGYLFLRLMQDDETVSFIKLDMETGNYTLLPYQKEYGTLTSMNYYDGEIYLTFHKEEKCYLCKSTLNFDTLTLIGVYDSPGVLFNLISIAGDKLYLCFPYSEVEAITLDLK